MNSIKARNSGFQLTRTAIAAIERGFVPDVVTRWGIRRLCRQRLAMMPQGEDYTQWSGPQAASWKQDFMALMDAGPIAVATDAANEQHYELPPEFFTSYLGPRRKYSACLWSNGADDLAQAEEHSLQQVAQRASLVDGMNVLDVGCGWGSFSLWVLEKFPNCRVTAVSNSAPQREFIMSQAALHGWSQRLNVLTADMNDFQTAAEQFDRIVSIEMFEHIRNYRQLLSGLRHALRPDGQLFIHIFCHRNWPYLFETAGASNWMGRYFFTGGMMPSFDQLEQFGELFHAVEKWQINGIEYGKTLDAWLDNFDRNAAVIQPILQRVYGQQWSQWKQRWRVFLMASSELFRFNQGREWFVGHYLLHPSR